jgi:predicted secreted protein
MPNGKWAKGTTLAISGNAIAELQNISGPNRSRDTIDVSSHDSADGFREFVGGFADGGEVSIDGNFYPADTDGQYALNTAYEAGTASTFTMTFPASTGSTFSFSAIVTAFNTTSPHDGKLGFTATLKISGKPTFSVSASTGLTTPFFACADAVDIAPDAANDVYEYVVEFANATASTTVTPTASAGTITVDGNTVTSGEASSSIALTANAFVDVDVVVTETNKVPVTYTLHLYRKAA